MPAGSPKKEKGHYSDPSSSSLTPLRTEFLTGSPNWRARSLSPRKRWARQPLQIRMNLTEGQMDKITDAFSQKVQSSPARTRSRAADVVARSSPRRSNQSHSQSHSHSRNHSRNHSRDQSRNENPYYWRPELEEDETTVDSPTFSELMPGRERRSLAHDNSTGSLAERRRRAPLPPLQVPGGSGSGTSSRNHHHHQQPEPRRSQLEPVPPSVSPLSEVGPVRTQYESFRVSFEEPESASVYSQDTDLVYKSRSARPEPLEITRAFTHGRSRSNLNDADVDAYKDWASARTPSPQRGATPPPRLPPPIIPQRDIRDRRPRRSKSTGEGLRQQQQQQRDFEMDMPATMPRKAAAMVRPEQLEPFSPLKMYFRGSDFPSERVGEKTMIGDNGWLERTGQVPDKTKKTPQKKGGILEGIKKIAKDMADSARRPQHSMRERPSSQVIISLSAREQSLFYCELEYSLGSALNEYITIQLDKGRLNPDKLKRVADGWHAKGRPRVVGFRYDLETQLDLVAMHVDDFRFYGRRQADAVEIGGLLHAMRVNARAMSVRTLCHPDSVIAKQLVDSQSLFKLIGVPESQQTGLAEVAQFFKVIIEREADYRAMRMADGRQTKMGSRIEDVCWDARETFRGSGHRSDA